ncbi:MAG: PAS domain-containing protein, partial [Bacillota bacterium]
MNFKENINDNQKTKEELIEELVSLRSVVKQYKSSDYREPVQGCGIPELAYYQLVEFANDAIFIAEGESGLLIYANKQAQDLTGYSLEEIRGKYQYELHPIDQAEKYKNAFQNSREQGKAIFDNMFITNKKGDEIPVEISANYININGKSLIQGIFRDLTERKKNEESLIKNEKRYRSVFHNSPLGIFHFDNNGVIIDCNEKFVEIIGSSRQALIGFNMIDNLKNVSLRKKIEGTLSNHDEYYEGEYTSVTGKKATYVRVFLKSIVIDSKLYGGTGLVEDISEQRSAKSALIESERNYRELFDSANDAIVIFEPCEEIILEVNKRACTMYGFSREELLGTSLKKLTKDIAKGEERIQKILKEKSVEGYETVHFDKESRELHLLSNASIIRYKGVDAILSIGRDISERKRTESFILMLAQALRSTSECVSITDMNDKLLFANAAFLQTYGYNEEELYGKNMSILRSPNNLPEVVAEILPATLAGGWKGEILNRRKDGTEFPIYLSTSVVVSDQGTPIALIGVAEDISERKRIEAQLRKLS